MAFSVPVFNLVCTLARGRFLTRTVIDSALPCNLAMGRRVQTQTFDLAQPQYQPAQPHLLVPALTDVRDFSTVGAVGSYDMVEVPAGTGRWYRVGIVDDVGKGFPNEYRMLGIMKICEFLDSTEYAGLFWPTPIT